MKIEKPVPPTDQKFIRYEDTNFVDTTKLACNYSTLYDDDIETFRHGTHYALYKKLGSKQLPTRARKGTYFRVGAPRAARVAEMGHCTERNGDPPLLYPRLDRSGIWEGFIPGMKKGEAYKYHITGQQGRITEKGDPF